MYISDESKIVNKKIRTKRNNKISKLNKELDNLFSNKKLGSFVEENKTYFRIFAPSAKKVTLVYFKNLMDSKGKEIKMQRDEEGVWEAVLEGELFGTFYGYKIFNPKYAFKKDIICIDPYSKAVASFNTYFTPRRSIVVKENDYDWEGDAWIQKDWRDLIIYEIHIKDMTAHLSSGCNNPGTYKGLVEPAKTGGINYIRQLGINAVEIMPSQEFAKIEIPYKNNFQGLYNSWNPYEENYWGYMTAAYFAPEESYSQPNGRIMRNEWSGQNANQINDFKDMVKAFHKEGIAVIMDVVFNHLSEYETGNLKEIDKEYYFRLDKNGNFISESFCGNDLKTERLMVRRLIVDSILFWMKEYHIDGFRFDMGKLIDWETVEEITYRASQLNPNVILVCEPWGGGYDPAGFSLRGWGSWNDQFRNGLKGENPIHGLGWLFGNWYGNNDIERIKSYIRGTLYRDQFGLFQKKEHSVNYLASHDGYTLGDFIRIATNYATQHSIIYNVDEFVKLTPLQLKLNKLAALFLLTSQGIVMISEGDEFGRTKVIQSLPNVDDVHKRMLDSNSYNKDNETNYINYSHSKINNSLLEYYKGLIKIRNNFEAFRKAEYDDIIFYDYFDNPFAIGYHLHYKNENFMVLFNAHQNISQQFHLPKGNWAVIANGTTAGLKTIELVSDKIVIEPTSGCILKLV